MQEPTKIPPIHIRVTSAVASRKGRISVHNESSTDGISLEIAPEAPPESTVIKENAPLPVGKQSRRAKKPAGCLMAEALRLLSLQLCQQRERNLAPSAALVLLLIPPSEDTGWALGVGSEELLRLEMLIPAKVQINVSSGQERRTLTCPVIPPHG